MAATHKIEQDYAQRERWEEILRRAVQLEAYDLALATVETLGEQGQTFSGISDYTTIAVAAAQSGQIELALDLIERIEPSYMFNRRRVWGEAAVAYAAAGNFDTAFATAEQTQSPYAKDYAHTLARIGLQQRQAGQLEESVTTIDRAVQVAEELDYASERLLALNEIALEQAQAGLMEPATELLERALVMLQAQTLESINEFALQTVANGWVEIGEYGTALRVVDAIAIIQPDSPLWKTLLVDRLIDRGDYAQALDIIESRDASSLQAEEMVRLAELYVQRGQYSLASQILDRANSISDAKADHLLRIGELYDHMGQTDRVLPVLGRAFEVAQTIPGEESQAIYVREDLVVDDTQDRGSLYEEIAVAYGRVGAFEQGAAVVQALQDSDTRAQAMTRLDCYRNFSSG